jgi:hypothetical protein
MIKLEFTKSRENPYQHFSTQTVAEPIPYNWLTLLLESWSSHLVIEASSLTEQLNRHIGTDSTYSKKEELIQGLKEIYLCLVNQSQKKLSEKEKQMLLLTISSGIDACSPGFHNRIIDAQQFIQLPCSIEQFMLQIRTEIVDETARAISSDVHDHNKIFLWAKPIFGVNVANESDPYINNNPSLNIEEVNIFLDEQFKRHYQPLQLISRIEQKLVEIFQQQFAYSGFQEAGYDEAIYQQILKYLNQVFQNPTLSITDYFVFDDIKIQDIHWAKIKQSILEYMIHKQIIICSEFEKYLLTQYILGKKNLDPNLLLLINNEIELLYLIKLFYIENKELLTQLFLHYLTSLPAKHVIPVCGNLIQFSEQPNIVIETLNQVNISLPLAPLMLQNDHEFEGFLLMGIDAHQQLTALLSLLNFLSPQQLSTVLRQRNFYQDNILTITADKSKTYFQELIAYIQPRIEPNLMFELLSHSNIENRNALIISYQSKTKNHETILSLIESLDPAKQRKILSKTTNDGYNCLDVAIFSGDDEFSSLLQFIHRYQPTLLPILFRQINTHGLNFLGRVITAHADKLHALLPYLVEFDPEYLFDILQQNNSEGKHALFLCAKYCPQFINDILQLLHKLDTDDAHSILKKLNKNNKSIFHAMKSAPYEFINDLLSFVHQYHPSLLTFILCHQEEHLSHPLFRMIELNTVDMLNFIEFVHLIPPKYQFELLISTNEDEFSLLASAVMYNPAQVDILLVNLLQHFQKDYAQNLVYFIYNQLVKLNHQSSKIQFIFKNLLESESHPIYLLKQEFLCALLNLIIIKTSKNPALNFSKVFMSFIQNNHKENIYLLLDMMVDCCGNHSDIQASIFIQNILMELSLQPTANQEKLVPYLCKLFKEMRRQSPIIVQSILMYYNIQSSDIKRMFYTHKDRFEDSIFLSSIFTNYETFSKLMTSIKTLSLEDQFNIITQKNNFGGNLIHNLLIHHRDYLHLKTNLTHYLSEIFCLPYNIQRALLVPDAQSNILGLVIRAIPDFFEIFLSQIKKIDGELEDEPEKLEHLVMKHYSSQSLSVGLIAAQQKSFNFGLFIEYLKMIDENLLFEILNQGITIDSTPSFFQAHEKQKNIFSCALPNLDITTLNELILVTQRLSLERQRMIIDKTYIDESTTIQPEVIEAFKTYQKSLNSRVKRQHQEVDMMGLDDEDNQAKLLKHYP